MTIAPFIWAVIGGLMGWFSSRVTFAKGYATLHLIVGIASAVQFGILFQHYGTPTPDVFNVWSILVAFLAAVVFLGILQIVTTQRTAQ